MGRRFTVAQLAAVLQLPASALLDPVQELISSELLAEGGAMLSFTHDLNREAVRASQPSSAVDALDRQAASALLAAGALPVEVATQLASSAAPGEFSGAMPPAQMGKQEALKSQRPGSHCRNRGYDAQFDQQRDEDELRLIHTVTLRWLDMGRVARSN